MLGVNRVPPGIASGTTARRSAAWAWGSATLSSTGPITTRSLPAGPLAAAGTSSATTWATFAPESLPHLIQLFLLLLRQYFPELGVHFLLELGHLVLLIGT